MDIKAIRVDGALKIEPAAPYLTHYLQYTHRSFGKRAWKIVNKFEKKLLYSIDPNGGLITFQGFFDKIKHLVEKNGDNLIIEDLRTPILEPNLQAIKDIPWENIGSTGLRDYQLDPVIDFLYKGVAGSGIVNCTGG